MPHRILILLFLNFLYFCSTTDLTAQSPSAHIYSNLDGLPSMTIYSILQDQQEYLWFGTANGICRYDGHAFKTYQSPLLKDNEILKIKKDTGNRIWFTNLSGQLFYLKEGEIIEVDVNLIGESKTMLDFAITADFLLLQFEMRIKGGSKNSKDVLIIPLKTIDEGKPQILNQKLFTDCERFFQFDQETMFKSGDFSYRLQIDSSSKPFWEEIRDPKEWKIILKGQDYYKPLHNSHEEGITPIGKLQSKSEAFSSKYESRIKLSLVDDQIWKLTNNGIRVPTEKENQELQIFNGYYCNNLLSDREGNIWIGTTGKGLIFIPVLDAQILNATSKKIDQDQSFKLYHDHLNDRLLVGQNNGGVLKITKDNMEQMYFGSSGKVQDISKGINGACWVVLDNEILSLDRELEVIFRNGSGGLKTLLECSNGNFWLGKFNSVIRLEKQEFIENLNEFKATTNSFLMGRTYSVFSDLNDEIWIGTTEGLFYYQEKIPAVSESEKISPYNISDIIQTKDSIVWVSTLGNGILKIKNKRIVDKVTMDQGLINNSCKRLFARGDKIWIATNNGINVLDRISGEIELINTTDGLPTNEINDIAYFNGKIWVATPKGVVNYPEDYNFKNEHAPPIYISNLKIWNRDTTVQKSYELKHDLNNFQIDFVGVGYRSKGVMSYKYQMSGIDKEWINTKTSSARYPILNPGAYEFQVLAVNEDGVESEIPASFSFVIFPPWWKTWWAILFGVLIVLSIGFMIFYYRIRAFQEKEALKQKWQSKVNELRHEALQTQMNPHFIFNSLNAIQHFISKNDEEQAMLYLSKFARLIRQIFEQSKKKEITLGEELEFLNYYLTLEKLRFKDKILITFDIEPSVNEKLIDIKVPPLMIQPILENSFKHGLFHRKGQGTLKIQLTEESGYLKVVIEDNGIGRKASKLRQTLKSKGEKSSGLKNIEERLQILQTKNGHAEKKQLVIIDLLDEKGNGVGTKVCVYIKIKKSYDEGNNS